MTELCRHIGPTRCPCWRYWVGAEKLAIYSIQKNRNEFTGVLTGKGLAYGGSLIRPEATGYGVVYFAEQMLNTIDQKLKEKFRFLVLETWLGE
jgi:glutamate dehydrogenase (NADP+)